MIDTTNKQVRRVITPIGEGTIDGWDGEKSYLVQITKADATIQIQSPCIFRFFNVDELAEVK
jgi:hypothetical protein